MAELRDLSQAAPVPAQRRGRECVQRPARGPTVHGAAHLPTDPPTDPPTELPTDPPTDAPPGSAAERADSTESLVRAAASGDQPAWNQLVDRYSGLVWAVIRTYRLAPADAADASQMTWLRLVENLDRIREPERLGSWLATSARRECLRALRRSSRERPDERVEELVEALGTDTPSPESAVLAAERRALVLAAVAALPERCQQMLWALVDGPRPDYAAVSATFGIPVGSIGPTRSRCLQRLRRELLASDMLADLD